MRLRLLPVLATLFFCPPPASPITTVPAAPAQSVRCGARIEARLSAMHGRLDSQGLDVSGYALHHALSARALDMYVTGMRVRVPARGAGAGWFRVDRCRCDVANRTLHSRLVFKDMAVTGLVRLYEGDVLGGSTPLPVDSCNMTLRFRKAGLSLTASMQPGARSPAGIETRADFIDPDFVSVYGHGCRSANIEHRNGNAALDKRQANADLEGRLDDQDFEGRHGKDRMKRRLGSVDSDSWHGNVEFEGRQGNDLSTEVEDVFLRGVKSLLTSYLEKQLQPALRETLMANLGYTVSYGKR